MPDTSKAARTPLSNLPPHLMLARVAQLFSEGAEAIPPMTPAQKYARRATMFKAGLLGRVAEIARGLAPFAKSAPITALASLADLLVREKAIGRAGLPDAMQALGEDHAFAGLAGLAPDLSAEAIVEGYACGLTLDARIGLPAWWAPRQRTVAHPSVIAAVLAQQQIVESGRFAFDSNFEIVLQSCRRGGLALNSRIMLALCALFDMGLAHSWEVRDAEGKLRAGGVGLAIGQTFLCLNAFSRDVNSGRFGLAHLAAHLEQWNYALIEAQALELACPEVAAHAGFGGADQATFLSLLALHLSGGRTRLHWKAEDAVAASLARPAMEPRIAA